MSGKIDTILAQGGNGTDDNKTGAIVTPLYFSTAYRHPGLGESTGFDYARLNTPTRHILEEQLAVLEHGVQAFATSSGMSAIDLVFSTVLKTGDHFLTSNDLYGGTYRYFDGLVTQRGVSYDPCSNLDDFYKKKHRTISSKPHQPSRQTFPLHRLLQNVAKRHRNSTLPPGRPSPKYHMHQERRMRARSTQLIQLRST